MSDPVRAGTVPDELLFDLVRSSLTDLAAQARPVDLAPRAVRRVRARSLALVALVLALLIGLPLGALAAGAGAGGRHSTPTSSPSLSTGTR